MYACACVCVCVCTRAHNTHIQVNLSRDTIMSLDVLYFYMCFLEKLSDLLMDQELDLGRAKRGLRVRRICSRLQRQKDLRIVELQEALITGKISLKQFLKMFDNEHECQRYNMLQMLICEGMVFLSLFLCIYFGYILY